MRRAFTLIEILVVVAIIGIMSAVAVSGLGSGTDAARLRGASRDVFATARQARSVALVTQQPCVVTYANSSEDGQPCAKLSIESVSLMSSSLGPTTVQTLAGDTVDLDDPLGKAAAAEAKAQRQGAVGGAPAEPEGPVGETMEEIFFRPVDSEVMRGLSLKVVMDGEEDSQDARKAAAREAAISAFSNTDFLLGLYRDAKKKEAEAAAAEAAKAAEESGGSAPAAAAADGGSWTVKWSADGRCEPHSIYIYRAGTDFRDGYCVRVDRFGAAKALYKENSR